MRAELLPRLRELCRAARDAEVALTIDAEEADRLPLQIELLEAVGGEAELRDWNGLASSGGDATMRSIRASRSLAVRVLAADMAHIGVEGRSGGIGGATRRSGCGLRLGRVATGGTKSTSSA